jgi:hypothetical protein
MKKTKRTPIKKCVRIVAEYAGDRDESAKPDKLIFDGVVNKTEKLVVQPMFGYYISFDGGNAEYPFRILPNSDKTRKEARLDWGSEGDLPEAINLFEKQITINEYFTWGDETYKIVKIVDLLDSV